MASDTRDKILSTAANLIFAKGYRGTSLDDVSKMSGVNRGSVYYFFKSKQDLGLAVFDLLRDQIRSAVLARTLLAPGSGKTRVRRLFKEIAVQGGTSRVPAACPLGHLTLGLTDGEPAFKRKFAEMLSELRKGLAAALLQARREGELDPGADADELALTLLCQIQGAFMMARSSGDPALVSKACAAAARQIPWTERKAAMSRA